MPLTNYPNGLTSFGIPLMGGGGIPAMFGNVFFVDYRNGLDTRDGKSPGNAFKTISKAYDQAVSNNNDLILIDGDAEVLEDGKITWSKNRIHLVGLGGGFIHGQRARWANSATGVTAVIDSTVEVSGVGNTFNNLKIVNTGTDAASIACLIDSGEANLFNNCSFMKFSDLNVAAVADVICRSDSCTYVNCELGFDTLVQSAARATFWIKASGATRMKHLTMVDCYFVCASSDAAKLFILIAGTDACAFSNTFKDCVFNAALVSSGSAAQLTNAVASVSGLVEGNLLFTNPVSNCASFCTINDQVAVLGYAAGADTTPDQKIGVALLPA